MAKTRRTKIEAGESTGAQVVGYTQGAQYMGVPEIPLPLNLPRGKTYAFYRELRKDPTLALARGLLGAAVIAGSWAVEEDEGAPEGASDLVKRVMIPLREDYMAACVLYGNVDYGWQGFEKVWEVRGGETVVAQLKPLLHDITEVLVDPKTGALRKYQQNDYSGGFKYLDEKKLLHVAFRVEGTQWYGEGLLENARKVYTQWETANQGAAVYDKKVAGSHFVVYYPPGVSKIDGADVGNGEVARRLLVALEASGSITVPRTVATFVDQLNNQAALEATAWKIELLEDRGGRQPTFVERLKYLDALKVRALLLPERAILEGQFGTKAEASAHADMAIVNIQLTDQRITRAANVGVVDDLLEQNFGPDARGTVRLVASPLVDDKIAFLRQVLTSILANPQGFVQEFNTIDTDALKDKLGVPKNADVAAAEPIEPAPAEPLDAKAVKKLALALATPRLETGKWSRDGAGLPPGYEDIDQALRRARALADDEQYDAARRVLLHLREPIGADAKRAVNHRRTEMLAYILHCEKTA